jgi:outer membrane protein OmpA-like peptidoglycan-associated protein
VSYSAQDPSGSAPGCHSQALVAQETEINGVTASLVELRQHNGVLRLEIALKNSGDKEASSSKALRYSEVVLVDARSQQKHFAMKDADGHYLAGPVSDWNGGGRWFPRIARGQEARVWLFFEPLAAASKVTVQVPLMFPFDDVTVSEGAPSSATDAQGSIGGLNAHLVAARRATGQLKLQLKITSSAQTAISGAALRYVDVFIFDRGNKQKYPLLKDTEGNFQAQPVSDKNEGGRFFLSAVHPNEPALMSLTFPAPPDTVKQVDLILPEFTPLEGISISGMGGSAAGGVNVGGKSLGLESALKDLQAEVTPQEIKINLSADVLFDFDKADIKGQAEPSLQNVVTVLKSYPAAAVQIVGYTDGKGNSSYNQALSERRARAVAQWLEARSGLAAANFHILGMGMRNPVAPNTLPNGADNPEGRAKNRRVEIDVKKAG